jgi:hypothetical protein
MFALAISAEAAQYHEFLEVYYPHLYCFLFYFEEASGKFVVNMG